MSFNDNGFLGEQINEIMSGIYNQNKELFDYIIELNSFAQRFKFRLDVKVDNLQQIVATCAFIKFLNSFQSVFILAQRGLESDSKVLSRTVLETLFILKQLCDNPEFTYKYLSTDFINRRRILNIIKNDPKDEAFTKELKESFTKEEMDEIDRSLGEEIQKYDAKVIKAEQLARETGLYDYYGAYRVFSEDVHTTPQTLTNYYNNDSAMFLCEPTTNDIRETLATLIILMFIALENLIKLFSMKFDDDEEFEQLLKRRDILLGGVYEK